MIVSVGDEVGFIFKFNCSTGKCSVILQNLPSEIPLNFLGFINNYPACRPAACKKFLQSQLGYEIPLNFLGFIINYPACRPAACKKFLQSQLGYEIPLNFLGFINNYPACRPAACKKFLQSQLGYEYAKVNFSSYRRQFSSLAIKRTSVNYS